MRTLSLLGAACFTAASALAAPSAALAQEVLAAPDSFDEFFIGDTVLGALTQSLDAAVGRILVGVSAGRASPERPLDLAAVRIATPDGAGDRLCVAMTTTDGRYSAKSDHPLVGSYATPPQLGLSTAYGDALARYTESELLVRASRAASCDGDAPGLLTPMVAGVAEGESVLVASVNLGRGRPSAWLERDGAPASPKARCRRNEQVAKSHDCVIDVAGLGGGVYDLVVDAGRLDGPSLKERTRFALP